MKRPQILHLPNDPQLLKVLRAVQLILERLEEEAEVYVLELLAHRALPLAAVEELRVDVLALVESLDDALRVALECDPNMEEERTAELHLERLALAQLAGHLSRLLTSFEVTPDPLQA